MGWATSRARLGVWATTMGFPSMGRVYQPHSLGIFYKAMTQFLGFTGWGDEYKVMGLAPYGSPTYVDRLREVLLLQGDGTYRLNLGCFRHHREDLGFRWRNCAPR